MDSSRFWSFVKKGDGCWEWQRCLDTGGYGQFSQGGRPRLAHRVAFELHYGISPAGMCVCHHCDNPKCVRPSHLFLGTQGDNNRDRARKGRTRRGYQSPEVSARRKQARIEKYARMYGLLKE